MEKGLELGGKISKGGSLCWLAVVPYKVKEEAVLARRLTTLDDDELTHAPLRWVSVQNIYSAAVSLLKPLGNTATSSLTTRVVMAVSEF